MHLFNFQTASSVLLVLLLRACIVSANINIYNWCQFDVYAYQIFGGDCVRGQDYKCYSSATPNPYTIHSGSETVFSLIYQPAAKIYLAKVMDIEHGTLQFEYTIDSAKFWYDLSYIDGGGDGIPGNIFVEENVTITPTGDLGTNFNCHQIACPAVDATTSCAQAYWGSHDDVAAMRDCPLDTGDMWIDLCGFARPFPVPT